MSRRIRTQSGNGRSFALERFAWSAPDRLELAGTFAGLDGPPPAHPPTLVLSGAGEVHRLPATAGGAPENGQPWSAAFEWQEPPAAFDAAVLRLGDDLAVELPEPGADGAAAEPVELPLRSEPRGGSERVRLETELLAAREELREARGALERAEAELSRARDDLRAEREQRAADALRFREGLAQVRAAADEELADVRAELDVAVAFQAENAALQERLDAVRSALG